MSPPDQNLPAMVPQSSDYDGYYDGAVTEGTDAAQEAYAYDYQAAQARETAQQRESYANLAERRYLWTARAFAIVAAISICGNIVLVLALFQLMPLTRVQAFLLSFQNKNEQIVRIEPVSGADGGMPSNRAITETLCRDYVLFRSTVVDNPDEMDRRWGIDGKLRWMSSPDVYQSFTKSSRPIMQKIRTEGLTQEVEILSINALQPNIWQVDFNTRAMLPQLEEPIINKWYARMRVDYKLQEVTYEDRLKNPLGFTVEEFALKRREDF